MDGAMYDEYLKMIFCDEGASFQPVHSFLHLKPSL